jgi:UDP-N-acetyl-D-glucosamine dehydrogenase
MQMNGFATGADVAEAETISPRTKTAFRRTRLHREPADSRDGETAKVSQIAVVGLGYVGLPLSLQFARSGVPVLGLDIDPAKVDSLARGESYIKHIAATTIAAAVANKTFSASTDFGRVREAEAVIICVPTPLTKNREPDISYIIKTGEAIAPHLKKGTLVVLESTTYPGTTDEDLRAVLEKGSGLVAGRDFHLAFSPEREDPGNPSSKVAEIPKIVGGLTLACREKARALYSRAVKTVVPVSSCRAAEATKLLENIFRSVNIALVNELKIVYASMDIDIWEVIAAAKTKPFGFMPFYPGPGLGGHCIPIDPFYLTWKAREYGKPTRFIELAGEVNSAMPEWVVSRVMEALNARRQSLNGAKILLLGLAYKANVDDLRESPTFVLMNLLKARGATVAYHDPFIPVIRPTREHGDWTGTKSVGWNRETISAFDLVLISTAHDAVNYGELAQWAKCIVDTRNIMATIQTKPVQVWKA